MSYLYGDSTPSGLDVNFIELLRDALEFCVQVLLAEQRASQGVARARTQERAAAVEIERLEKLGTELARSLEGVPTGEPDSATERCASAILRSAGDIVRGAIEGVRSSLSQELSRVEAQASRERDTSLKALEALLLKRDLPDTALAVHLGLGTGGHYVCRARASTSFGLEAMIDLEIPPSHLFGQVLRVERVVERLEVNAPEVGGWLHKEVKMKAQRLERDYVTDLAISADESSVKLRATPDGAGGGFDVTFRKQSPRVQLYRIEERNGHGKAPYNVPEPDAGRLLAVQEKLIAAAAELTRHRKAVVSATIDGEPLGSHEKPSIIVERLIATVTPIVQEIAARSHSPGELVLRRQLADDRREEIFVSKAELKRKLEPLTEPLRMMFEPLWRDGGGLAKEAATRRVSGPVPLTRVANRSLTPPMGSPIPSPGTGPGPAAGPVASPVHAPPPPPGGPPVEAVAGTIQSGPNALSPADTIPSAPSPIPHGSTGEAPQPGTAPAKAQSH